MMGQILLVLVDRYMEVVIWLALPIANDFFDVYYFLLFESRSLIVKYLKCFNF